MVIQNTYGEKCKVRDVLQQNIDIKTYFTLLQQVIEAIEQNKNAGVQVILDLETMEYENGKCLFQTVKEDSVVELNTVRNFVRKMTFATIFDESADCGEVTAFLHFMDEIENCRTLQDIYEYCVDQTYEEQEISERKEEYRDVPKREPERMNSTGMDLSAKTVMQDETGVLDPEFWNRVDHSRMNFGGIRQENNTDYSGNGNRRTINEDETGVLDPSYWNRVNGLNRGTSDHVKQQEAVYCHGQLLHRKTGVTIAISKDEFLIGKNQADLVINKPTISRKHAVIIQKGNHFFIKDNDSTNKTYVNKEEIPSNTSVEIFHGNSIKFADEEYEFQIIS